MTAGGRVRKIAHGIAIIATGAQEHQPTEYLYGENEQVLTQLALEAEIVQQSDRVQSAQNLVMIQCVGCRQEDKNYCSRVCCGQAVKNALKLKEINPEMDIHILFRDMRTYGFKEDYYREAADQDIKFIRFEPENKPLVEARGKRSEGDGARSGTGAENRVGSRLDRPVGGCLPPEFNPDMARFSNVR